MATNRGITRLTAETRALRPFQTKESIVGKLFAKHIKLEEAKQFLQRARYSLIRIPLPIIQLKLTSASRTGIGAGTPQRLSDLLESGKF